MWEDATPLFSPRGGRKLLLLFSPPLVGGGRGRGKIKQMKKQLTSLAKSLRQNQTQHERKLWNLLKAKKFYNYKFRRQYPIGKYIVDFCCPKANLIIELDGGHHNKSNAIERDEKRDKFLKNEKFAVLRIWNNEIEKNLDGVYQKILEHLK